MNELAQQVQQAYERAGKAEAVEVLIHTAKAGDWTDTELDETIELIQSYPKEV